MIYAINAAIIKRNRILLVEKDYGNGKSLVILPGGKVENGEGDLECLAREIREELCGVKVKINPKLYRQFRGKTPSSNMEIGVRVYFAKLIGGDNVRCSEEISAVAWTEYELAIAQQNLSPITREIVNSLRRDKYLPNY